MECGGCSKESLYKSLPKSMGKLGHRIGLQKVSGKYIKTFLKQTVPENSLACIDDFKRYIFNFEKYDAKKKKRKKCKTLINAATQRKMAVFKMDPDTTKFDLFLPVHEMWKQYMESLLQLKNNDPKEKSIVYQKLIKADYHGCFLTVESSVCQSYIGLKGIVVQETRNTFILITPENQIKTVPKKDSVFAFVLGEKYFKIYGKNFRFLPHDRCKIKYKTRAVVKL